MSSHWVVGDETHRCLKPEAPTFRRAASSAAAREGGASVAETQSLLSLSLAISAVAIILAFSPATYVAESASEAGAREG